MEDAMETQIQPHEHDWERREMPPGGPTGGWWQCQGCGIIGYAKQFANFRRTSSRKPKVFPYLCSYKGCRKPAVVRKHLSEDAKLRYQYVKFWWGCRKHEHVSIEDFPK